MPLFSRLRRPAAPDATGNGSRPGPHAPYAPPVAPPTGRADGAEAASDAEPTEVRIVGVAPTAGGPTWELEMLVSGALTFALLQAPGALDEVHTAFMRDASQRTMVVATLGRFYVGAMIWALVVAFVLNLTARAYWVGLVGLQTVFPQGPRWERWRGGPYLRHAYAARGHSLPRLIARVDRFASILFSVGFLIVLLAIVSAVTLALSYPLGWLLAIAVDDGGEVPAYWLVAWLLLLALRGLLRGVDRLIGPRLRPGRIPARALAFVMRGVAATNGSALVNPIRATLVTNAPRGTGVLLVAGFVITLVLAVTDTLARRGAFTGLGVAYVPENVDLLARNPLRYESLGGGSGLRVRTMIQSDIVTDPYLRLFVPYHVESADEAVPLLCPGTPRLRDGFTRSSNRRVDARERADADRALACLARAHWVRLDGRPVTGLRWRFATHRPDGRPGLVAYVPVQALPPGEHMLVVGELPTVEQRTDDAASAAQHRTVKRTELQPDSSIIPFWR